MRLRSRAWLALGLATALLTAGAAAAPATPAAAAPVPAAATANDLCEVSYILNDWGSGFQATVTVTNVSDVPVHWTVIITFPPDVTLLQVWNVMVTQSGDTYRFEPPPWWSGPLPILLPGQSASFGFVGTGSGVPENIEVICTPAG